MSVLEILTKARELVSIGWTKGAMARDVTGASCRPENGNCWRAVGAVWAAAGDDNGGRAEATRRLRWVLEGVRVESYNDSPSVTKEEVLGMFDCAIKEEVSRCQDK